MSETDKKATVDSKKRNTRANSNVNTDSQDVHATDGARALITKEEVELMIKDAVAAAVQQFSTSYTALLNEKLTQIEEKIDSLTMTVEVSVEKLSKADEALQRKCDSMERTMQSLLTRCHLMESAHNDLEQYGRRNNLLFRGLEAKEGESSEQTVCNFINNTLSVVDSSKKRMMITPIDIDIAHPLSTKNDNHVMIAKFVHRSTKMAVIRSRRQLKGKAMSLSDDLTQKNQQILTKLRENPCVDKSWAWDGKVFAILKHQTRSRIFTLKDPLPSDD